MSEEQYPLPWNPDEACKIDNKLIQTRLDQYPEVEVDGTLFNRDCDGLDNTIPRRKDKFITICPDELPDVPKEMLKNKHFETVSYPGVISTEIPKALMAQLLGCCLKDRTAGFDFEAEEELDGNGDKVELDFEDSDNPVTKAFTIQLGTEGFSYLRFGLNIKPELCFCDEDCGDEDYIHLKVNFGVEYHDENDDPIQDPDLVIEDEQLTNLISNFGGGGGGNPLCAQKMFAQYDDGWFSPMTSATSNGPEFSLDESTFLEYGYDADVFIAPYLHNLTLTNGGIYKLEYFCEYDKWVVTDGECAEQVSSHNTPKHHETVNEAGEISGEFDLVTYLGASDYYTVRSGVSASSTLTEAEAFSSAPSFDMDLVSGEHNYLWYTATVNNDVSGIIIYNIVVTSSTTNKVYSCKIVFHIDTPEEEEGEEEEP